MIAFSRLPSDDPLAVYSNGAVVRDTQIPVPLTATRFAVTVTGAVASVRTWRSFRNAEAHSIEVTLTVPMPVRSVLYALDAAIGGRILTGIAQSRTAARSTYETAIDEGRLAVLHEEVLCGVHMVSIAHLPPGADVTIHCAWAAFLKPDGEGRAGLRIPLTVGDIYGRSPLPDSDDLITGGAHSTGRLTVAADDPGLEVCGRRGGDAMEIPLDRPIDLSVAAKPWPRLWAKAHDGRRITLAVAPAATGEAVIDAAVLIDKSGSMTSPCCFCDPQNKLAAVCAGLDGAAATLRRGDHLRLFAFDNSCLDLGTVDDGTSCRRTLAGIGLADGGTETGQALSFAMAATAARDIVLLTDGQSHALDVAALVRSGRRFSVVLIGEDSLEAQVGYLAARSGGALIVARGKAVAEAVETAFASLRHPHVVHPVIEGVLDHLSANQDGLAFDVRWDGGAAEAGAASDAVRALASALAVSRLPETRATALAVAEGLVGPLTSLVLVDAAGTAQEGLPVVRKVALPSPARQSFAAPRFVAPISAAAPAPAAPAQAWPEAPAFAAPAPASARSMAVPSAAPVVAPPINPSVGLPGKRGAVLGQWWAWLSRGDRHVRSGMGAKAPRALPAPAEATLATQVPGWPAIAPALWTTCGDDLARGDLRALPPALAARLRACGDEVDVVQAAQTLGLSPLLVVIGVLARRAAPIDRAAARVARTVFKEFTETELQAALAGLPPDGNAFVSRVLAAASTQ